MPDVSDYATLDLLDPEFAEDLVAAIESGIAGGVVFPSEPTVEAVFRSAVQAAVGAIKKGTARSCDSLKIAKWHAKLSRRTARVGLSRCATCCR